MNLSDRKYIFPGMGVLGVVALGLYFFVYSPLLQDIRRLSSEYYQLEPELAQARSQSFLAPPTESRKVLLKEDEISIAMDEITRAGKLKGVKFISITPGKIEHSGQGNYRIFPVEMHIVAGYENTALFMDALDDLEKSIVTVESFEIACHEEGSSQVKSEITIHLYLEAAA